MANFRLKINFFPSQAKAKNRFVWHSRYTWDTPCRVWFDLNNFLTQWKIPYLRIKYSKQSQISVRKAECFPKQALANFFLSPDARDILHTDSGLIWTTLWPDEKDPLLKFANREIFKFPYEKLTFLLDKL